MSRYDRLSAENLAKLKSICEEFEKSLRDSSGASIEKTIESAPSEIQPFLLKEIIAIEISWLQDSGSNPAQNEYLERFPNNKDKVKQAFQDTIKEKQNSSLPGDSHGLEKGTKTVAIEVDPTVAPDEMQASLEPGNTLIFSDDPDNDSLSENLQVERNGQSDAKSSADSGGSKTGLYSGSTVRTLGSEENELVIPIYGNEKRFLIESEIDRGGMGVVLKVRDIHLDRILAMKVIRGQDSAEGSSTSHSPLADRLARFVREASITSRLDHPGVVPVHEMGKDDQGRLFFTMKLVRGKTLSQVVKEAKSGGSSWTRARILEVMVRVCDTLAFAHNNGVIHRDLKPSNIMVGDFGEAYVMDWGLAKVLGEQTTHDELDELADRTLESQYGSNAQTLDGSIMGTPHYMPPEQALGRPRDLDERCDIYSLGAMLYEILTARKPYAEHKGAFEVLKAVCGQTPKPIREIEPKAPNELVAIAEKAMQKEAEDRYQTASELAQDLRAFLDNRVVSAYRTNTLAKLEKWAYRNRTLVGITLTLSFVALAIFAYFQADKYRSEYETNKKLTGLNDELNEKKVDLEKALRDEQLAKNRLWGRSLVQSAENLLSAGRDSTLAAILSEQAISKYHFDTIESKSALYAAAAELSEQFILDGHSGVVEKVEISPDESLLATCSFDGTCVVWDLKNGSQKQLLINRQNDWIKSVRFTNDGKRILIAGNYGSISLWDIQSGERIWAMQLGLEGGRNGFPFSVLDIFLFGEKNSFIAAMKNGNLFLVDLSNGETLEQHIYPKEQRRLLSDIEINQDSTLVASGFEDGRVELIGLDENGKFKPISSSKANGTKPSRNIKSIDFSDDGKYFAAAFQSKEGDSVQPLSIRHTGSGKIWKTVTLGDGISSANFLPGTDCILLGVCEGEKSYLAIWDLSSDMLVSKSLQIDGPARNLAISAEGNHAVSVNGLAGLFAWSISKEGSGRYSINPIQKLNGHIPDERIQDVTVSASGNLVVSGGRDQTARVWRLDEQRAIPELGCMTWLEGRYGDYFVRFRPDGKRMLLLNRDLTSGTVWSLPDYQKVATIDFANSKSPDAPFTTECRWEFSEDNQYLFAAISSQELLVWSAQDGKFIKSIPDLPKQPYTRITFNASSKKICVEAQNMTSVFDLTSGEKIFEYPKSEFTKALVDASCENLLVLDENELTRVDLIRDNRQPIEFEGAEPTYLSPDGKILLCKKELITISNLKGNYSFTYHVLDAQTGNSIFEISDDTLPQRMPRELLFSRDSKAILVKYRKHPSREVDNDQFTIWSIPQKRKVCEFGHAFSGILASTAGFERFICRSSKGTHLFDGETGKQIAALSANFGRIGWAEFSHDGKLIIAHELSNLSVPGKRIKRSRTGVWDAETGELMFLLPSTGNHYIIGFAPDNQSFLTVNASNRIQSWPMDLRKSINNRIGRSLNAEELSKYSASPPEVDSIVEFENKVKLIQQRISLIGKVTPPTRREVWRLLDSLAGLVPKEQTDGQRRQIKNTLSLFHAEGLDLDPVVLSKASEIYRKIDENELSLTLLERAFSHPRNQTDKSKLDSARKALFPKIVTFQTLDSISENLNSESELWNQVVSWLEKNDQSKYCYAKAIMLSKQDKFAEAAKLLADLEVDKLREDNPVMLYHECLSNLEQHTVAFQILTQALNNEFLQTRRIVNTWISSGLTNQNLTPAQLLKRLPSPSDNWIEDSPIDDAKWLLGQLKENKSIRINCGSYRDSIQQGKFWSRDRFFTSGLGFWESDGEARSFAGPIQNTNSPYLYQTERWFDKNINYRLQGYSIPLPNGRYTVRLGFAEIYPTKRDFDVLINGQKKISNYDPGKGKNQIATFEAKVVVISDGILDISLQSNNSTDSKISSIEIISEP